MDNLVDDVDVHIKIVMGYYVSYTHHLFPIDSRISRQ